MDDIQDIYIERTSRDEEFGKLLLKAHLLQARLSSRRWWMLRRTTDHLSG